MLTLPPLRAWFFDAQRAHDFAQVCPVCLKVWAVVGGGEQGFNIGRQPCLDCAYGERIWYIWGGPSWHRVEASLLDTIEAFVNTRLTRQPPTVRDILNVLPPPAIRHEFLAHLNYFTHMMKETDDESQGLSDG